MRTLRISCILVTVIIAGLGTVSAQGTALPPTIIQFTSSLDSISVAEAEAGLTTTELSWQVVGLDSLYQLALYAYRFNSWQIVPSPDGAPLPAEGSLEVPVEHPLNFGPPSYKLVVNDAQGVTLEQRVLTIPYADDGSGAAPVIDNFASTVQTLGTVQLAGGMARVPVGWTVSNRGPMTNLVFEQVLDAGRTISVELPRPNLWVPSAGEGVVAPILPDSGRVIRIQMRVVDITSGATLAEQMLPPIQVTGAIDPTPAPPTPPELTARILSFEAAPHSVTRGGTVTVTWQVEGSNEIGVWLLDPSGRLSVSAPNPAPAGSWTVTLPEYYSGNATFMLFADDAANTQAQSSLTVLIVCPFPYFFPTTPQTACPEGEAVEVQASFDMFENGYMIWRADTSDIYVLSNDGQVRVVKDRWLGEMITFPDPPPAGMFQPMRGFGRVWVDNPAIRAAIGWSVSFEQGYTMTYQWSSDYTPRLYLNWPDGTVIYLTLFGDTGSWGVAG